ncbi:hypothetical protein EDC01DRAFT_613375 [Geopyxis carbonaria]|nr:hypothetical protein EDC01DRAFT_613375 [Geopyxis carbonaria]
MPPVPPPASPGPATAAADDDDDDDYMNMVIEDAPKARVETLSERQRRKQRESEIRGRPKSKAELAREETEKREAALAKSLIDADAERTSKGLRMMKMMGFKPGTGLGRAAASSAAAATPEKPKIDVRLEPIAVELKDDRAGIGMASERKRKLVEAVEAAGGSAKRRELEPEVYREGLRVEREERRKEGLFYAAQKVCEQLDLAAEGVGAEEIGKARAVPLKSINVLWRGMVAHRENREAARRIKYDMLQSLTEPTEERVAAGATLPVLPREGEGGAIFVEDQGEGGTEEEEDTELGAFDEMSFEERLDKVTEYLRERHRYCFWCKYQYKDEEEMAEACPGTDEDSHG